jgi:ankyrin repeat protein
VSGGTLIHSAVNYNRPEAIDLLLALGADVNAKDQQGLTPLHLAVRSGHTTTAAKLLEHGAIARSPGFNYQTPFMVACSAGMLEPMKMLIHLELDRTVSDILGQTALHLAARQPHLKAFIYLLDTGWNPHQIDCLGCSPIYYALSQQHFAAYIYAKGLDLNHLALDMNSHPRPNLAEGQSSSRCFYRRVAEPTRRHYLNSQSRIKLTPLMEGALDGNIESMRICVQAGANLEICHRTHGTPLIIACRAGQLASIKFLVRQGALMDCLPNGNAVNAFQVAKDHQDVLRWLLVDRWTDLGKLTSTAFNRDMDTKRRFWSGVRTIGIPLQGTYKRPAEWSLMEYAKHLHRMPKGGWRVLVPLGWDTVAHFIPLPEELRKDA